MKQAGELAKSISAIIGVLAVVYYAGATIAGKAEASDQAEMETRLSVLESRVEYIIELLESR